MPTTVTRLPDGSRLGRRVEVDVADNHDEWDIGTLLDDLELHGVELPAGTMMSWDPDLPLLYATLRRACDVRGHRLPPGCRFEFAPTHLYGFPGLQIPLWLFPVIVVYLVYRLIRRVAVGTGRRTVRVFLPTPAGRPTPHVALYTVSPDGLLPVTKAAPPRKPT